MVDSSLVLVTVLVIVIVATDITFLKIHFDKIMQLMREIVDALGER